jgi:hypothetical protein
MLSVEFEWRCDPGGGGTEGCGGRGSGVSRAPSLLSRREKHERIGSGGRRMALGRGRGASVWVRSRELAIGAILVSMMEFASLNTV